MRAVCLPSGKPLVSIRRAGVILRVLEESRRGSSCWGDFESTGGAQVWLIAVPLAFALDVDLLMCRWNCSRCPGHPGLFEA